MGGNIRINSNQESNQESNQDYKNISGISFVSKILKEQNRLLLEAISDKFNLTKEEKEELFSIFWKTNYYCPQIIVSQKKEQLQKAMTW